MDGLLDLQEALPEILNWLEAHPHLGEASFLRVIDRTSRGSPEILFRIDLEPDVPELDPEDEGPEDQEDPFAESEPQPEPLDLDALGEQLDEHLVPELVGCEFIRLQLRLMASGGRKQVPDGSRSWAIQGRPLASTTMVVQEPAPPADELGQIEEGTFDAHVEFQVLTGASELRILQREFMRDQANQLKNFQQATNSILESFGSAARDLTALVAETHGGLTHATKTTYEGLTGVIQQAFDTHTTRHLEAQRESAALNKELARLRGTQTAAVEDLRDRQDRRKHIDNFMARVERVGIAVLANKAGIPEELVPVIEVLAESDELLDLLKSPELRHLVTHASKEELADLATMLKTIGANWGKEQPAEEQPASEPTPDAPAASEAAAPPPPEPAPQASSDEVPPPAPT